MNVLAAIDLISAQVVRLYQGDFDRQTTYTKSPVEQAVEFEQAGFNRLHVIDLEGARAGSGRNREVIGQVVERVGVPVQVGGGIRRETDVDELLGLGVAHLILGTVALKEPGRVTEWVRRWGPEGFIISLDLRKGRLCTEGWLEESPLELETVLRQISDWGIPQVICTDVESDGTLEQPNYSTYEYLLQKLSSGTHLIAAGGVTLPEHISQLSALGVQGAVLGRALYEGTSSWRELIDAG